MVTSNKELVATKGTELLKIANAATEIDNPLEAENFLLQYRLAFLESLRPTDAFADDYIFYYGLKLKLILRIKQFVATLGENTYKNIYDSILNGDRMNPGETVLILMGFSILKTNIQMLKLMIK